LNRVRGTTLLLLAVLAGSALSSAPVLAQDDQEAAADTTATGYGDPPPTGGRSSLEDLQAMVRDSVQVREPEATADPLFLGWTNAPKAGVKANVRQNTYYGDLVTQLKFRNNSTFRNTFKWSWEEYRKQEKTVQKRDNIFSFGVGTNLPVNLSFDGAWNWSEDKTTNTAGFANLTKRDAQRGSVNAMKSNFRLGFLNNTAKASGRITDQKSVNQNQRNDFSEAALDAGLQTDMAITEGVTIAGRVYGMTLEGDRLLGQTNESSSANGDTLGFGVYYKQTFANGRVAVTRSNFQKNYLDFKRNSNGLIDTVGLDEDKKVVSELETTDALSYELENNFNFWRVGVKTRLTRQTNDHDFAQSGVGLREREQDMMDLALTFGAGRDSFALGYDYLWKWDDQRYKNATENRGRQYSKSRDFEFNYYRDLFRQTGLNLRYHEGLSQDIAEDQFNDNDKDRHQRDFSARLDRTWAGLFRANMVFAYQQVRDFNIRASRSSNNNVRDSYELSPGYAWTIAPWLSLDQSYRVYIQYTNYSFSGLETVNRDDDYNKRGNLATKVTLRPSGRLDITLRHDYNKRFSATKSGTDAIGNTFYRRDLNQTISKIEMSFRFQAAPGVTLEASTYRTRDDRENLGARTTTTRNYSGEMWSGVQVSRRWFQKNTLELSAMVRKFNAFGPSVTETSSDYWEADIWLKWEF
jgi:hypothetical protein